MGAEGVLTGAVSTILQTHPDLAVDTMAVVGQVTQSLISFSRDSSVLVLGVDADRRRSQHGMIGPMEERVAAHSECPTVWVSRLPAIEELPQVLAIVPGTPVGMEVLGTAAAEATLRAAELQVVIDPVSRDHRTDELLARALLDLRAAHAGLMIMIVPDELHTDDLLVSQVVHPSFGRHLELVVLAGPHTDDRWSLRTGHLGPALARNGRVPVMYVGTSSAVPARLSASLAGPPTPSATHSQCAGAGLSALPGSREVGQAGCREHS